MFIGEFQHTLDDKGRVPVPARFRGKFADGAVVTRGLDRSLFLYTKEEWMVIATKIAALPLSNANARSFSRLMLAGAMEVELDRQGRIILPGYLRQFAGLTKNVVFAGLGTRIEIWEAKSWSEYQAKVEGEADTIVEDLNDIGL